MGQSLQMWNDSGLWMVVVLCLSGLAMVNSSELLVSADSCHPYYYTNPECIDHPDGYGCECGPGFHWNTHKCMSSAIDSRFEFKPGEPIRYTLLLGKGFPKLKAFTIAFWINVSDPEHPGTILSYKHGDNPNLLRMMSGPTLNFEIWSERQVTDIRLVTKKWYHIALTWDSSTGAWVLYISGSPTRQGVITSRRGYPIPSGGEFVLGQSSRPDLKFDSSHALDGDLSHLNIWNFVMEPKQVSFINSSSIFMYCGNAVQWVEFRSGTRGAMKMRWPSGIFTGETITPVLSAVSCDKFCSDLIGAQCNEEIKANIKWSRQRAEQNISVLCPSVPNDDSDNSTSLRFATRSCKLQENDNDGEWQDPYIDDCISDDLLELKKQFLEFEHGAINEIDVLRLADRLLNHTEENVYLNPIDIATVIDLLAMLVKTQGIAPRTVTWREQGKTYATTNEIYPTFKQTKTFCELLINVVNNLLAPRNEAGWNATRPSGAEGDNLMHVMHDFADVISRSLDYHIRDGLVTYKAAMLQIVRDYVEFKIETQWTYELHSVEFPDSGMLDKNGRPARENGFVKLTKEAVIATNASGLTVFLGISTFRYKTLARMLPTHEITMKESSSYGATLFPMKTLKLWTWEDHTPFELALKGLILFNLHVHRRSKEDRVNSPILALYFHVQPLTDDTNKEIGNLTVPLIVNLPVLNTFNISNPECVMLRHGKGRKKWKWVRKVCRMVRYTGQTGVCACSKPGVFAITTDMYDENWDKGDKRPKLMNFASYFGCTMSATLCLMVCGVHFYLRTSTSTAALHRNLSVSIALSQLVFMFGIDRYETPTICQVFAILLHYFFLATYSWVMNEAFNLYIVITYSAHNPSDLTDSGSMIRYYILGWVLPAILVGAFVGTSDNYYAKDMCWVAPDHMWLFIGPAIGIMSITILVLIFTAKEHNENSYTKSDKTNKIINIHMKALWTQVILVTVCWAFAFISIKMVDTILKYLYAMFTSLQGAFFVVFYMFLHEEVRAWIKSRQKRRALQLQGFEYQDNHSLDSFASNSLIDRDIIDSHSGGTGTVGGGSGSVNISISGSGTGGRMGGHTGGDGGGNHIGKDARPPRLRELSKRKNRARIEASSDEGSDCEMISSV